MFLTPLRKNLTKDLNCYNNQQDLSNVSMSTPLESSHIGIKIHVLCFVWKVKQRWIGTIELRVCWCWLFVELGSRHSWWTTEWIFYIYN